MTANKQGIVASDVTVRWSTLLGIFILPAAAAALTLWASSAVGSQRLDALESRVEVMESKAENQRDRIEARLNAIEQTLARILERLERSKP